MLEYAHRTVMRGVGRTLRSPASGPREGTRMRTLVLRLKGFSRDGFLNYRVPGATASYAGGADGLTGALAEGGRSIRCTRRVIQINTAMTGTKIMARTSSHATRAGVESATAPSDWWTTTPSRARLTSIAMPTAKLTRNPARRASSSWRRSAALKKRMAKAAISITASGNQRTGTKCWTSPVTVRVAT